MISVTKVYRSQLPDGIILYQGPSRIDQEPIIVIATGFNRKSKNIKTGDVVQTYILVAKENPISTYVDGHDRSICGDCKHSSLGNGGWGTCYVNVFQAPGNIWRKWKAGKYDKPTLLNLNAFRDKIVRLGSYGDPSAVPIEVWNTIAFYAKKVIGYTHQWNKSFTEKDLQKYCMASVDNLSEFRLAKSLGWRTFRVRTSGAKLNKNEISCPASKESGNKTICEKCTCCSGISSKFKKDISIIVHGRRWVAGKFARRSKSIPRKTIKN